MKLVYMRRGMSGAVTAALVENVQPYEDGARMRALYVTDIPEGMGLDLAVATFPCPSGVLDTIPNRGQRRPAVPQSVCPPPPASRKDQGLPDG